MGQQTVFGRLVAVLGLLLPVAWPLSTAAAPAPAAALVTIIEGDAIVLRDTARFAAAEGLRLRADDIITTGTAARLVRIELDDGKTLDLGPATQLMLLPRPLAREAGGVPTAYLLQGWLKLTVPAKAATPAALATPRLDVVRIGGTLIASVAAEQLWVFAEAGGVDLQRRRDGKTQALQPLRDGDSFLLAGNGPASVSRTPPAALRGQVPRPFLDTLPRRADRFAGRTVEPVRPAEVAYAEIAPWVNAEPALRTAFVQRLTPRARDTGFRNALVAEMKLHPEWQPVLFPPPPPPKRPPSAPTPALPPAADTATAATQPEASPPTAAASGTQ